MVVAKFATTTQHGAIEGKTQTVRAAMDYGHSVKVVGDACATMDLAINGETVPADMVQKAFLAALDGVFATII